MIAVESKKEFITQISVNPKIYKPKAKKLCSSYMPQDYLKKKSSLHITHKNKTLTPILNFNFNFDFDEECITNIKNKNGIKNKNKCKKLQIEKISFEEMEKDFSKLKERKEIKKAEKELIYLLRNSTKDDSQDENLKDQFQVKRPKKPLLENFE